MSDTQGASDGADLAVAGTPAAPDRSILRSELWLVLWLSIAASALYAVLSIVNALTSGIKLSDQSTSLITSYTPDRPWLDLMYQFARISIGLVPVVLVGHLLRRSGEGWRGLGLDGREPGRDILRGAVLAAVVGASGLVLYLVAYHLGFDVRIAAVTTGGAWWTLPMLVLYAAFNALLEETIVLGYLLHRCEQLGVRPAYAVAGSALLRGAYHLYQGLGGFLGNFAMGLLFAVLYRRWRRLWPFLLAHFLIDAVAFVGYTALHGNVSWLP